MKNSKIFLSGGSPDFTGLLLHMLFQMIPMIGPMAARCVRDVGAQMDITHWMKSSYWKAALPCCIVSLRLKWSVRARILTQQAT